MYVAHRSTCFIGIDGWVKSLLLISGLCPFSHIICLNLFVDMKKMNHSSLTSNIHVLLGIWNYIWLLSGFAFQEYGARVISTIPTVPYIFEYSDGRWGIFMIISVTPTQMIVWSDYVCCSKVQVQNPATLASNPGKRVAACWEPSVIATIIIPSE